MSSIINLLITFTWIIPYIILLLVVVSILFWLGVRPNKKETMKVDKIWKIYLALQKNAEETAEYKSEHLEPDLTEETNEAHGRLSSAVMDEEDEDDEE